MGRTILTSDQRTQTVSNVVFIPKVRLCDRCGEATAICSRLCKRCEGWPQEAEDGN